MATKLEIAIRFVQQFNETPDPAHEKAMAIVLRDTRDVPIGRKYCDAREFLRQQEFAEKIR